MNALVLFDDPVMRMVVARHLRCYGFDCTEATHGGEAGFLLKTMGPFDLVIFECYMCTGRCVDGGGSICQLATGGSRARLVRVVVEPSPEFAAPSCRSERERRLKSGFSSKDLDEVMQACGWDRW